MTLKEKLDETLTWDFIDNRSIERIREDILALCEAEREDPDPYWPPMHYRPEGR